MRRIALLCLALAAPALAQQPEVRRAQQAYADADFAGAIAAARRALDRSPSREDRVIAFEVLGFAYAALDSSRQAEDAFRELIFLDPDREPDANLVSPRITSHYNAALGRVLVVRRATVDSATFVAGQGGVAIRYQVSRSARVVTRVVGPGLDVRVDSQIVVGMARVDWNGLTGAGAPAPAGEYQVIVTAVEGQNDFAATIPLRLRHGAVDTIPHLATLPGYDEQPETVRPPRDWRPLGVSALIAGVAAGASFALGNSDLSGEKRREIGGASVLTIGIGLFLSLRRAEPQPVEANIRYNQLLREQLAQRNAEIAAQNLLRRRQVLLTITPGAAP